jgi:hypothetical protein
MLIELGRSMNLASCWLSGLGWKELQADFMSYQLVRYEFEVFFYHKPQTTYNMHSDQDL